MYSPRSSAADPLLDRYAQPVELERFLGAALLQRADRVAHRLAGVAVFTGLQHLVDEGVLLRRQTDIAGRHRLNLADFPEDSEIGNCCQCSGPVDTAMAAACEGERNRNACGGAAAAAPAGFAGQVLAAK